MYRFGALFVAALQLVSVSARPNVPLFRFVSNTEASAASGVAEAAAAKASADAAAAEAKAELTTVPKTWTNTALPKTVEAFGLALLANRASDNMWSRHDQQRVFGDASQGWHAANVYTSIANNDRIVRPSHPEKHGKIILNDLPYLNTSVPFLNGFNDDAEWWALAALDAAEAYDPGNQTMVDLAAHVFEQIRARSQIQNFWYDKQPFWKTAPRGNNCNLTGGVFWQEVDSWAGVPSISTTLFVRVGARLYDITKDEKYLAPTIAADEFIKRNTLGEEGLIFDGYNWTTCVRDRALYTYNQGVFIGSQLDLYKATGDAKYLRQAEAAGTAGLKHSPWLNNAGEIIEGKGVQTHVDGSNFRSIWIRHLHALYTTTEDQELRGLIRAFTNVNFNLLLSAGDPSAGAYSQDWFGGYNRETTEWGMCSAVDVLTAAYVVNTS